MIKFKVDEIVIGEVKGDLELGRVDRLLSETECIVFYYTLNRALKTKVEDLRKLKNSNKLEIMYKKVF